MDGTTSGNFCYSISNNLPKFCLFPSLSPNAISKHGPIYRQDWTKFNQEDFILDYLGINWQTLFQKFDFNPDQCLNIFNDKIKVLVERHVPTVKLTKRQIKTKLKPWITPGILKSISKRDFYHRKFIKAKKPEDKAKYYASFKSYRNSIVTLSRQSKSNHFTKYFNRHSKNMKKVWSGVRNLICSNTVNASKPISINIGESVTAKPETVANHFNNFFTSIADTIRSTMPPSFNHFSRFLKNRNANSIYLTDPILRKLLS